MEGRVRGSIQQSRQSKSGKTLSVQVNGKWYTTKNWELENMVGQTINFEPSATEYNGQAIFWINEYDQGPATTADHAMSEAMANQNQNRGRSAPSAPAGGTFDPVQCLPMTSNLVAHAIQANLCAQPADIDRWARAAYHAAKNALTGKFDGEPFDDDIPF